MVRFLVRSVVSTIVTILLVSIGLFLLIEVGSGDISVKILGVFATPEQRASYRAQLGLNAPVWQRYLDDYYAVMGQRFTHGDPCLVGSGCQDIDVLVLDTDGTSEHAGDVGRGDQAVALTDQGAAWR